MRLAACILFALLYAQAAFACFAPPQQFTVHHANLVERTASIVLARVLGPSDQTGMSLGRKMNLAEFETLEILKGAAPPRFTMKNGMFVSKQALAPQDFEGHSNLAFWERGQTRQWNMPDCQMRPVFLQDRTYLLFLDSPHWRSYEEIVQDNDLWLEAVRHLLDQPTDQSGLHVTAREWLSMANGVFYGSIASCSGPTLKIHKVFSGSFPDRWRYTDHNHSQYWRRMGECIVGAEYVIATLSADPSLKNHRNAQVFAVKNDTIDLSLRRRREIVIDEPTLRFRDLEQMFNR